MSERVFVAMSGGVDSSFSAYLLKESGFNVTGIHLELSTHPTLPLEIDHSDLESTCRLMQIPLVYLHLETEFREKVIDYFCEEYSRGRTPNPCIRCNRNIKFGLLLNKALEMGADYLATGHYARVENYEGEYRLFKGADPAKDQSYFLYILGQRELRHVLFPLSNMLKMEVKRSAAGLGLPSAKRRESQDICFIPGNDSRAFIAAHLNPEPGEIVDVEGNILGRHRGLAYYTIGQRQGMGVSAKERLYVIRLDSETNRLVIGPQSQLFKKRLTVYNLNWISGQAPEGKIKTKAKVRYRSQEAEAELQVEDGKAEVYFSEPQRAIANGQSAVFYQGDMVLGGGIIGQTS